MAGVTLEDRLNARKHPTHDQPLMHQDWRDLLFLHWKYDPEYIQQTLPPGLYVDTYKGSAYVTIQTIFIENLSVIGMPNLPGFSDFIEVNLFTYVYDKNGIPGIWFYSLFLNSLMGVSAGRQAFLLPYYYADFEATKGKNGIHLVGKGEDESKTYMDFYYKPETPIEATPKSLPFFLSERYVIFAYGYNEIKLCRIHHKPFSLCEAVVYDWNTQIFDTSSIKTPKNPPHYVHYSSGVDVDIYNMKQDSVFPRNGK